MVEKDTQKDKELSQEEKDFAAYVKQREADHVPNPLFQTDSVDTSGGGGKTVNDISPIFDEHRRANLGEVTPDESVYDTLERDPEEQAVLDERERDGELTGTPADQEAVREEVSKTRTRKAPAKDEAES